MSRENVEVVRAVIELNRSANLHGEGSEAHIESMLALWDAAGEYTSVMASVDSMTYRGHDELRRYLGDLAEGLEDWRSEIEEIREAGPDTVFASIRTRVVGRGSGAPVEAQLGVVFVLSEGKIVRGRTYPTRAEALEAVGLGE